MNLILDEKKIRKGKPVGLPYQGSKKKISKKIIEVIKQNFDLKDKKVYDIFGGGGAITAECLINGIPVHYNDLDSTAVGMFTKVLYSDKEYLKTLIISREDFFKLRDKENKTIDDELKLLVNSFGNNRKNYLHNEAISDIKYNLAKDIIDNHDVFNGYIQTYTYKKAFADYKSKDSKRVQQLECLGQLQRVQQLECLGQLQRVPQLERLEQLKKLQQLSQTESSGNRPYRFGNSILSISTEPYQYFSDLTNQIIYLDPPYENTRHNYKVALNYSDFYDWCVKTAKDNIVLLSSYEISDNRFECVFEFKKARPTFQSGTGSGGKYEKLFMVKGTGCDNDKVD
ncbi:DNA adenine methylase [Eremococcus coleocola]|uniref:DNA adenine methylase n=1 Tax=Eremococcus coleocola TaxID=88132 RepID=UPI00040E09B1|nr:DNA adenine methylase [Eremococcus coleocola]